MGWLEAIKAALIAVPEIVGAFRDLIGEIREARAAAENIRLQEVRDAQRQLQIEVMRVTHDEERARLARRISELERRL